MQGQNTRYQNGTAVPTLVLFEGGILQILLQRHLILVAFGKYGIPERPLDGNIRVVPGNSAFSGGFVESGLLILDLGDAGERRETVCKTGRDVKLRFILGRQFHAKTFSKRG